ncbi:hypothetical protein MJO28_009873 [Puccinia striiformis f. sp. tritici]|uniref:Mid2 domain-containing protein n=4 Tax=Puccinia striiformis TaxID=27350 RepID=A0A2S4UMM5_9BASI|nr:hypothetical protein Pst134EA_017290 [Puccinia striiformis f. sp. tritici]KAI9630566.1 hypothetical protein KEM48_013827 [Puccinia striiformis f. sp. tritici PST-130]KNF00699.1 hypothetical protein PSTG_06113 [Puccinia striiformis f. sp. tritici PST-78]POV93872.1 hypothetical protein PSHT_16570 [Puccinia striiformis]KAH9450680.1 hypothetical protein Pst134EB_018206 [Puccinia striiformis f. sp. tritici]KAH9460982.1 hypothetical protein Pst134EA_017290 [Puccinia striiformis f. sp. tritici]
MAAAHPSHNNSTSNVVDKVSPTTTSATRSPSSTPTATITREVLPTAVTLVFQVGSSTTATTILLNSVSTALPPTSTATPSIDSTSTSEASSPSASPIVNPVRGPNLETHKISSDSNHMAPIIGGVVGGVLVLALVAFTIFLTTTLRRRRRERETLDMMAPSQLQDPFFHVMRTDPRQSFTWVGPIEKPSSRRGSRLAL